MGCRFVLREENAPKSNSVGMTYWVCLYWEWLERHKVADRHFQIKLYIEIVLSSLNAGMPQQFADLGNRHASASAKFGIGPPKIMGL